MLSVIMLNDVMLSVIMLNDVMLSVIMLIVVAPKISSNSELSLFPRPQLLTKYTTLWQQFKLFFHEEAKVGLFFKQRDSPI
jgi:hypothetical protein